MKIKHIVIAVAAVLLTSCGKSKQIEYFQDVKDGSTLTLVESKIIKVKPNDKLTIAVNSRNPELAMPFNLPYISTRLGQGSTATGANNTSNGVMSYAVDADGNIEFPCLGKVHVAGMSRVEIADALKQKIISTGMLNDPTVTVEYDNLSVSVLGEVARPGRYAIDRDNYTIYDALSAAGDLTIYGVRDKVKVVRTEGSQQNIYTINMVDAASVTSSPAYYLQQGDMVYVAPNDMRARQSTVNGNTVLSTSFWISLASLLTTVAVLVFK